MFLFLCFCVIIPCTWGDTVSLLVSDYDGTFANSINNIELNCKMISRFLGFGNHFVLSSGRSYNSLLKKVNEFGIPYSYLACADGCFLFDKYGKKLMSHSMDHGAVSQLAELKKLAPKSRVDYTYERDYDEIYDSTKPMASVSIVISDNDVTPAFLNRYLELKEQNPEYDYISYGFEGTSYYMIKSKGVSKSSPIEFLKEKLFIPSDEIFTVGDGLNDMEMIRDYNGFVIGNEQTLHDVALGEYPSVWQLANDIMLKKVKRR